MSEPHNSKDKAQRQPMPEQPACERVRNFDEVPYGYDPETAAAEAARCLKCKKPLCVTGCPVEVDIPGFVSAIAEGDVARAIRILKETNALPAICGRVCPQETQCEARCILGKKGTAVAIGNLERFAADWEREQGQVDVPETAESTGRRIAVVGSGPAGLTCAGELVRRGHEVIIFEALHAAGGVLVYGIPEFRLPKSIVKAEIDILRKMGVQIQLNAVVGKLDTIEELLEQFDAVFIGTGAGLPKFKNIPGENLVGVYSANEYLTRANLMRSYLWPASGTPPIRSRRVVVIGGGNVAMDSARTAVRLGAEKVILAYRRSGEEMPARAPEIHHAEQEGVEFALLVDPIEVLGDAADHVRGLLCLKMKLGEPDDSGRRRPLPIEGSEFEIECDTVIPALGNDPNPLIGRTTEGLKVGKWGNIEADLETGRTNLEGVYAGGDIVTGAATVIEAMGAGRKAAGAISEYVMSRKPKGVRQDCR
ncbi:MAG: NADPH-dependent glutamate synthase [Anaerolineaceae bacterium]|nr:NADPH-dependent glutamate synthase [Anaerolineaceae bacterium]